MARYTITTWNVDASTKIREIERRTWLSAVLAFRREIYSILESFGLLDTRQAWTAHRAGLAVERTHVSAEPYTVTIGNTGRSVSITRVA